MCLYFVDLRFVFGVMSVEQAWCRIYGMAPSIQAQHVVAVTIPTIAVLFLTYFWYKKRSNSITRSRSDPGGGGISKKRSRHRNTVCTLSSAAELRGNSGTEIFPEAMKHAMQKAIRDLETASPIQEICSDSEENSLQERGDETSVNVPLADGESMFSMQTKEIHNTEQPQLEENNNESDKSIVTASQAEVDCSSGSNTTVDALNIGIEEAAAAKLQITSQEDIIRSEVKSDLDSEVTVPEDRKEANNTQTTTNLSVLDSNDKHIDNDKTKPDSNCCSLSRQQYECKNSGTKQQNTLNSGGANDDLDVAMLKLESMRLNDKSKRKVNNTSKRQNHITGDTNFISNNEAKNVTQRPKSPSSVLPRLDSPPSKARKRKSKKKSKSNQNVSNNEDSSTCKLQNHEVTSGTTSQNTCDSVKFDTYVNKTNNKDSKCTTRKRKSSTEKMYLSPHENDSLSCILKESNDCDLKVTENHRADCDNERDSANHSPVDTILDSQSVQFSDAHSEGSSDSGKGCSEGAVSPSPQTPAGGSSISGDQNMILLYQFVIPQEHVGKLIGKNGQFINTIKSNSNTRIYIKKHPVSFKKKICALEGTQQEINKALELIRRKFPEDTYPDITLEEFPISQPIACPLRQELFQLDLVEGVNNDVVISSVVTAGHLFLQQPMHPTYQSLTLLNISMNQVYNSPEAPLVLKPMKDNIVAAPAMGGWYRAQIVAVDEETETCDVRFLDYGGYLTLNTTCLRAVRADFLTLPFQAVECFLANIAPVDDIWTEEAKLLVQGLTYGHILQAQVYDYTPEGIPLILLYAVHASQVILINQELVARGYAYPTTSNEGILSDEYLIYS